MGGTALKPTARVVDFVAGFDLKAVPALAIERARLAFIDTVGVMLAEAAASPPRSCSSSCARRAPRPRPRSSGSRCAPRRSCRAGERGRLARARLRLHLYPGPAARARDPRAPSARREHRRDAGGDARGLHRRLRGLLAAEPRQSQPQRRRRLARHRHHRHDRRGRGLRAPHQAAGGEDPRRARHRRVDGGLSTPTTAP